MPNARVRLTRIIDDGFPAFGVFELKDIQGVSHEFYEKLVVVGVDDLTPATVLPVDVAMPCAVLEETETSILISTSDPHSIEAVNGQTQFWVSKEALSD